VNLKHLVKAAAATIRNTLHDEIKTRLHSGNSFILILMGYLYSINTFEGVSLMKTPDLLWDFPFCRNLPIMGIKLHRFGNGEWLLNAPWPAAMFGPYFTESTDTRGYHFQYYSKH
jgi:hypothetical protein